MTDNKRSHRATWLALAVLVGAGSMTDTGPLLLGDRPAEAVIGRPLTPVSYAGVARRTSRRTTRRAYYGGAGGAYGYGHVGVPAGYVTALPAGCAPYGGVYRCGAVSYRPYYYGATLVYAPM
ncbi:MAG TPA: hypothetical protein VFS15_17240 [Kofleriaceae bacterium]|nr:hypothetical protein [Kofleriaceae bacterium]